MLMASLLETLLVSELASYETAGFWRAFPSLFVSSFLAQITVYCLVFMANYALTARTKMQAERGKANMAQYRYMKLKQQVNPHFLFNSLNILDCLVCEEQNEKASLYIHKLAGIYRYMIKSEEDEVVPLRDELSFVEQYVDASNDIFNVGTGVGTSLNELIKKLEIKLDKKANVKYETGRSIDAKRNVLNMKNTIATLGNIVDYSLDKGIDEYMRIMKGRA